MGFNSNFTINDQLPQAITRVERARGFLEAVQLSADWVHTKCRWLTVALMVGLLKMFRPDKLKYVKGDCMQTNNQANYDRSLGELDLLLREMPGNLFG